MRNEMSIFFDKVGYKEETHPALLKANRISSLESLLICTLNELTELKDEHEKLLIKSEQAHKKLEPSKAWWLELADLIVMLKIINEKTGGNFSVEELNPSINGQFKGHFRSLEEQVANLGEGGDISHNFNLLFTELMSLIKYMSTDFQGLFFANMINTKLFLNRESRFFKIESNMDETDIINKNNHVFKALRILRNFVWEATGKEEVLQPWITDFFEKEISDWRNSELALKELKDKVLIFKIKIKDELSWTLTVGANDPLLEIKMMLGGAKEVGIKDASSFPLQSWSSNATLAETTVFWT